MLRYVLVIILFSIAVPLVMISLQADRPAVSADQLYDEDAFVEQQAPYSSAHGASSSLRR